MKNQVIASGIVAGMRFTFPLTFVSAKLGMKNITPALQFLSLAECFYDQSDFAGNRTEMLPLVLRILSGTVSGAILSKSVWGGMGGGMSAFVSTFATFYLRNYIHENFKIPQVPLGFLEDLTAALIAYHTIDQN